MNQTAYTEEEQDSSVQDLENFLKHVGELPQPEEKLKECIDFMRNALAQQGSANFRGFWEIRKFCLPLFKDPIAAPIRSQLWTAYIDLTREGRRLKNLLDEESAFAVEQIDLAIQSLEDEVRGYHAHLEEILEKMPSIEFPGELPSVEEHYTLYQKLQKQLNLLNLYASKINSLRKELIHTEMRIRQKNKFFQRLSQLGDQVFPARKELIQTISNAFIEDVTAFTEAYFGEETFQEEKIRRAVFFLRAEIKNLQAVAKILTLNTHAFSTMRQLLSGCWDKLKGMEKELRKEYAEHKQKSSENAMLVQERIESFKAAYAEQPCSYEEGIREVEEISRFMRSVSLTRSDVYMLKDLLKEAQQPLSTQRDEEARARKEKEAEFEKVRQDKINNFNRLLETLQHNLASAPPEQLSQELEELRKTLPTLALSKAERQQIERVLKTIRDHISEKQNEALLLLSDADRAALEDLEAWFNQLEGRRKEVKHQIEEYRKVIGGSGLDFEKAMSYNELMSVEKERLAKIDESIQEIKKKMRGLKKMQGK